VSHLLPSSEIVYDYQLNMSVLSVKKRKVKLEFPGMSNQRYKFVWFRCV